MISCRPCVWLVLLAFTVTSCSTAVNLRSEDYSKIDPHETYHVVMTDGREYMAKNLAMKDGVATFTQGDDVVSVPVDEIKLIQQVNEQEVLTGVIVVGIALAIVAGLVVLFNNTD
jgi:hypothetical protein